MNKLLNRLPKLALSALTIGLTTASPVFAQEKMIQGTFDSELSVTVAPGEELSTVLFVIPSTKGNQPLSLSADLIAPKGATLSWGFRGGKNRESLESILKKGSSSSALDIFSSAGLKAKKGTLTVGENIDSAPGGGGSNGFDDTTMYCNGEIPGSVLQYYLQQARAEYGPNFSIPELCAMLYPDQAGGGSGGTGTTPTASTSSISAGGLLYKDVCTKGGTYLLLSKISLDGVSAEDKAAGFTITYRVAAKEYEGGRQFKVKQKGDGMFPVPLFLGNYVVSTTYFDGEQKHAFAKWSNGKIKTFAHLPIRKSTFYRGLLLGVSLPGKYLRGGGKANAYVTNGGTAYGVCIKAVASNQLYNGYTN